MLDNSKAKHYIYLKTDNQRKEPQPKMPILQETLLELIEIGLRSHQRLEKVRQLAAEGVDPAELARFLDEAQMDNLVDRQVLIREQEHFRYRKRQNDYARQRLARKRKELLGNRQQVIAENLGEL